MPPADPAVPILFLPGTLCDARVFAPLAGLLPPDRVIHADLTGDCSAAEAAARLLAALPERFITVGFSLGAIVALELAAQAPHRVVAMALIAGNARDVPPADHAARRAAVADVPAGQLVGERLWPRSVHPSRLADAALRAQIVAMAQSCPTGTAQRQTELALSRADSRPRLAAITAPVLVLSGAADPIAPPEWQREMVERLPAATWTEIANAGHFLLLERPAACARAFAAWLDTIPLHLTRDDAQGSTPSFHSLAPEVP